MTKYEKDLNNPLRMIMNDLEEIAVRIEEVEKLDLYIDEKMRTVGKFLNVYFYNLIYCKYDFVV